MKVTIASVYWLLIWGTCLAIFIVLPSVHFIAKANGISFLDANFQNFDISNPLLHLLPLAISFCSLLVLHLFLIMKNKVAWYVGTCLYTLQAVASVPLLLQKGIWGLPTFNWETAWDIFLELALLGVFMTYFTLFSLITERKLFLGSKAQ